jgi:hypothetical protein
MVAICAAYAIILHSFFGALVLAQNANAASNPFVICYGAGDTGSGTDNSGKPLIKHQPCLLCSAAHASGTLPDPIAIARIVLTNGARLSHSAIDLPILAQDHSPRLSQGPPLKA